LFVHPGLPLFPAETRLALAFQTRSSSVGQERSFPISANSMRATRYSAQCAFLFSSAPQLLKHSSFPLWRSVNWTPLLCSILEEFGPFVAPPRALPPAAFARAWVQEKSIRLCAREIWFASMPPIPAPPAQVVALLARKPLVSFRERRPPPARSVVQR